MNKAGFESLYQKEREPWAYTRRAAEVLRHDFVVQTAQRLLPAGGRIADLGCSLGQLTCRLGATFRSVLGVDISHTAIRKARHRCASVAANGVAPDAGFSFSVGSVPDLPLRRDTFDLLLLCDGLHGWELTREEQLRAVREAHRAAAPGGYLIFTDYIGHRLFGDFLGMVRGSGLEVVEVHRLGDRLWYSLERSLRKHKHRPPVRALLANRAVGRALSRVSGLAGARGSRHFCIVARKPPTTAAS